jgi:hypothetical protein
MSMQDEPNALDTLIDDAARALTTGSPSAALRENVRARLVPRRGWRQVPVWQPALGAAVLGVVAMVLMSPDAPAPTSTPASSGQAPIPGPASSGPATPPAAEQAIVLAEVRPALPGRSGGGARRVPRREQPSADNQVAAPADPLPPIEPLEVEPVSPIELAVIERIPEPMPLRIQSLQIERLFFE